VGRSTAEVPPHGVWRYRSRGCRCDTCRDGAAELKRKRRLENLISVQPLIDKYGQSFVSQYSRSLEKWTKDGVPIYTADRICCARGNHPYEVFGDLWFEKYWKKDKS
jgi:hypothetical protein